MFKLFFTKKKFTALLTINLFLSIPLLYLKSTSDTYLFIKYIFLAVNIIGLLYINSIYNKRPFPGSPSKFPLSAPFAAFVIASFISVIGVENIFDYFMIISCIVLYFFLFNFIASEEDNRNTIKIITVLMVSCFIVSVYGILQYMNVGKYGPFDFEPARDYYNLVMHPSTLGHDNFAGEFLSASIPFIISLLILSLVRFKHLLTGFAVITLPTAVFYLIVTQSRSAWIGFISSLLVMIPLFFIKLNFKEKLKFLMILIIIIISIATMIYTFLGAEFINIKSKFMSIFEMEDNPIKFRFYVWSSTLTMIKEYFPFGVGAGNFKHIYPLFRNAQEISTSGPDIIVRKTHNEYLQVAVELGPLGFFSFFWIITASCKSILILIRRSSIKKSLTVYLILVASTGSLAANLVQSLFGFSLQNPVSSMIFFGTLGFISSLYIREIR